MTIETKFNVNDLSIHKHSSFGSMEESVFYEIMEVQTVSCYKESQVFYLCKAILLKRQFKNKYTEEGGFVWELHQTRSREDHSTGWEKLREDELVEFPKKYLQVIDDIETQP